MLESHKHKVDLDLSLELPSSTSTLSSFTVTCGDGLYVELKIFRKNLNINFSKFGNMGKLKIDLT